MTAWNGDDPLPMGTDPNILSRLAKERDTERTRADKAEQRERELLKLVRPLVDAASRFNGVYVCQDRVAAPFQGQMMLALQAIGREMPSLIQPEPDPLVELRNMLKPANEDGCSVFDHTAEEIGLHVMENHEAIVAALSIVKGESL